MKLETYLDNYKDSKLNKNILLTYKYFGYKYKEVFELDLNLLLTHVYTNIELVEEQKSRIEQQEFRTGLLDLYGGCVVTGNNCAKELEACHIIPFSEEGTSDLDNGLLLQCNIHKTFDEYYWSINPETLKIEVNSNIEVGTIKDYVDKKVNLEMNPYLYTNLQTHYEKFINNILNS